MCSAVYDSFFGPLSYLDALSFFQKLLKLIFRCRFQFPAEIERRVRPSFFSFSPLFPSYFYFLLFFTEKKAEGVIEDLGTEILSSFLYPLKINSDSIHTTLANLRGPWHILTKLLHATLAKYYFQNGRTEFQFNSFPPSHNRLAPCCMSDKVKD